MNSDIRQPYEDTEAMPHEFDFMSGKGMPSTSEEATDATQVINLGPASFDEPDEPDADNGGNGFVPKSPRRSHGLPAWLPVKTLIIGLVTLLLAGGGTYAAVHAIGDARQRQEQAQQQADNELRQYEEQLNEAVANANDLLERIGHSPVADDIDRNPLEQTIHDEDLDRIIDQTERTEQSFAKALKDKATAVRKTLDALASCAEALQTAPDSTEHAELDRIAGQWKTVAINGENLTEAINATDKLSGLVEAVEAQKTQAEQEQREREEQEWQARQQSAQQQASPAPQPQVQSQPRRQPQSQQQPVPQPAPSWNVPGQQPRNNRLPGRDGSL